jgi:ribonucleoside-diphosphate reductase alpha chain
MPFEDFKTVYLNAYNLGLKGCTTYRPSDIRGWVLSTTPTPKEETPAMPLNAPMERPEALRGMTYKLTYPNMPHSFYVCINDVEENGKLIPFEIFVNSKDIHTQEWLLPLTRMISAVFRRGRGDVAFVAEELQQVFSIKTGTFYNGEYCPSLVAALGKIIEKHFISIGLLNVQPTESKTGVQISDDNTTMVHAAMQNLHEACPVCKKLSYRRFDGCYACSECGYSKCD